MYKNFKYNILMKTLFLFFYLILIKNLVSSPIVDSEWLSKNLCKENIKIIEVGNSYNSYLVEHIQCSQFTNFYKDGWRTDTKSITMSMPLADELANILEKLGIYKNDHVILYSKKNSEYSVAETTAIYFTFKYLSHEKISILNGGYPDFKKKYGLFIDEGDNKIVKKSRYDYKINKKIIATFDDVIVNKKNKLPLIDSREQDFYLGINKLKGFDSFGTIEGAINIPSKWFLKERGLEFNDFDTINSIYEEYKIDSESQPIFFCYAGLESSVNWFVAHELKKNEKAKLFEGSIFEWKTRDKPLHQKFIKKHRQ